MLDFTVFPCNFKADGHALVNKSLISSHMVKHLVLYTTSRREPCLNTLRCLLSTQHTCLGNPVCVQSTSQRFYFYPSPYQVRQSNQ